MQERYFNYIQNQKTSSTFGEYRRFQNPKSPKTLAKTLLRREAMSPQKMEAIGQRRSPGRPTMTPPPSRPTLGLLTSVRDLLFPMSSPGYKQLVQAPRSGIQFIMKATRCREEGQQLEESRGSSFQSRIRVLLIRRGDQRPCTVVGGSQPNRFYSASAWRPLQPFTGEYSKVSYLSIGKH